MAFNLSKGEDPTPKKSSFDLSKTDPVSEAESPKKKPVWLIIIAGVAVIALAAWYLTGQEIKQPNHEPEAVKVTSPKDSSTQAGNTAGQKTAAAEKGSLRSIEDPKQEDIPPAKAKADVRPGPVNGGETDIPLVAASFRAGSSIPQIPAAAIVAGIRKKIKDRGLKINVLGYASSEGSLAVNQAISQARADAYKQFLVKRGIADSLVTAQGKGIENPIAPNNTEEGRKKNRRVEVTYH